MGGIRNLNQMISENPRPPTCNTGVTHPLTTSERTFDQITSECSIDHLRLTGRGETYAQALNLWNEIMPGSDRQGHGNQFYRDAFHHPLSDASLWISQITVEDGWMIELGGTACEWFESPEALLTAFSPLITNPDVNCSRIDLAVDLFGPVQDYIESLIESAHHDPALVSPVLNCLPFRKRRGNVWLSHGVNLGSRASARYLRVYDKGLERKSHPKGQWVRWEAEYKHKASNPILSCLASNPSDDSLRSLSRGVIENVLGPGKEFAEMVHSAPLRPRLDRSSESLAGHKAYLSSALSTVLRASQLSGMDPLEILARLDVIDVTRVLGRNPRREKQALNIIAHVENSDTMPHMPSIRESNED